MNDLSEKILKFKKLKKKKKKNDAKNGKLKYFKYFNSTIVSNFIINKTLGIKLRIKNPIFGVSKLFSIIIPTLNNLKYLKICIKSISKNSKFNHELFHM